MTFDALSDGNIVYRLEEMKGSNALYRREGEGGVLSQKPNHLCTSIYKAWYMQLLVQCTQLCMHDAWGLPFTYPLQIW